MLYVSAELVERLSLLILLCISAHLVRLLTIDLVWLRRDIFLNDKTAESRAAAGIKKPPKGDSVRS